MSQNNHCKKGQAWSLFCFDIKTKMSRDKTRSQTQSVNEISFFPSPACLALKHLRCPTSERVGSVLQRRLAEGVGVEDIHVPTTGDTPTQAQQTAKLHKLIRTVFMSASALYHCTVPRHYCRL